MDAVNHSGKMRNKLITRNIRFCLVALCLVTALIGYSIYRMDNQHVGPINAGNLPSKHVTFSFTGSIGNGSRFSNLTRPGSDKAVVQIGKQQLQMIYEIQKAMRVVDSTAKPFNFSCDQKSRDSTEDLLCMPSPKFLQEYRNPCWYSPKKHFQCLPYFQVIGVDKCGSTDLFDKIAKHPDVLKNGGALKKETMWWSWLRYGHWLKQPRKKRTFQDYLNYFRDPSAVIQKNSKKPFITGDGTPMDVWDNSGWRSIPQNNNLKEPKYITPHLIRHINPNVKLLIILRDPIERLFSDYFFLGLGSMTTGGFHQSVVQSIELLHSCVKQTSLRNCLYDRKLHLKIKARIHLGFYLIFLQDWFQVFPKEQFMIIRTEDFSSSTMDHMKKVYQFLGLHEIPEKTMKEIANAKRKHATKRKKQAGKMKPETRRLLQLLYESFNEQLALLLSDQRFSWKQ